MKLTSIADLEIPGSQALEQGAWDLTKLYDSFFDNFQEEHEREAGIHATELNQCLRQVVYTLFRTPKHEVVDRLFRKKFQVGHSIHGMIQGHFKKMAANSNGRLLFDDEVRVQDTPLGKELCLTSSCDGIFTFLDDQGAPWLRVGVELKSKSPKEYEKLKVPEKKHVEQAHLYMAALDIPLVWFLYWDKGSEKYTPSLSPFLVRFDPAIWQYLEGRARVALDHADRGVLPDQEVSFGCSWCPYAYTCNPPNPRQLNTVLRPLRR